MATTTTRNKSQQQERQPKKKSKPDQGAKKKSSSQSQSQPPSEQQSKQQSKQQQQPQQQSGQKGQALQKRVEATLARLEKQDPGLKQLLKEAHGYAVFPSVGKAALVVGGAYGRGAAFEKGKLIGYATMSQLTIGVQIGGDTFTEILVFHDKHQLDRFRHGHMAFAANASAVLVKAAAAGTNNFKGVTAHAYSSGGMLLELALGGQKFRFNPIGEGGDEGEDQGGESGASEGEESEGGGMLSRAVGGVTKVPELAKGHPIVATVIGAGALTGLAFMLVRALRQRSAGSSGSDSDSDEQHDDEGYDEDDEDTEAQGSDNGEQEYDEDEGEEEEEEDRSSRRGRSRV